MTQSLKESLKASLADIRAKPTTEIVTITPEAAQALIRNAAPNRNINQRLVNVIADDILANRWVFNGEAVIIDDHGLLIDGQHRLLACIKANRAIKVLLVRGVPSSAAQTIDTGRARNVGDVFSIAGVVNSSSLATVSRHLLRWDHGLFESFSKHGLDSTASTLRYFQEHEAEITSGFAATMKAHRCQAFGGQAFCTFSWIVLRRLNKDAADDFWNSTISGANLTEGSPMLILRNRLMRDKYMPITQRAELVFRAWNAWREGRSVRTIPILGQIPELHP